MPAPTLLIAPDSFKGSLSAAEVARAISAGVHRAWPEASCVTLPLSDGGDGLLDAIEHVLDVERRLARVHGPMGEPLDAPWLFESTQRRAWIAADEVVPLAQVGPERVHHASTRGVGELIRLAQDAGAEEIIVGIGGTGTLDGGAGALAGLGCSLRSEGSEDPGEGLHGLGQLSVVRPATRALPEIELLCDVQSPLVGSHGAALLYGSQKGLVGEELLQADRALCRWGRLLDEAFGCDPALLPFAGAGGGLAAGLMAGAGAVPRAGAPRVAELLGLEAAMGAAMIVVTGEGRVDAQSAQGKVLDHVLSLASTLGRPVQVIAGQIDEPGRAWLARRGARGAEATPDHMDAIEAHERASELVEAAAFRAFVG